MAAYYQTGWQVSNAHGRVGGVYTLAAVAAAAENVYAQIAWVDNNVSFFGFWQHGNGDGGSVDAPLAFGCGNALDAVHATFEFKRLYDLCLLR